MLDTMDAGEARPAAEFDTEGERTAVQKFLYPDRQELPDDFSMPIWARALVCSARPECDARGPGSRFMSCVRAGSVLAHAVGQLSAGL